MTVPGDATTGSTFLNDLVAGIDYVLVYGSLLFTGIVIGGMLYEIAKAVRADFRKPKP